MHDLVTGKHLRPVRVLPTVRAQRLTCKTNNQPNAPPPQKKQTEQNEPNRKKTTKRYKYTQTQHRMCCSNACSIGRACRSWRTAGSRCSIYPRAGASACPSGAGRSRPSASSPAWNAQRNWTIAVAIPCSYVPAQRTRHPPVLLPPSQAPRAERVEALHQTGLVEVVLADGTNKRVLR